MRVLMIAAVASVLAVPAMAGGRWCLVDNRGNWQTCHGNRTICLSISTITPGTTCALQQE